MKKTFSILNVKYFIQNCFTCCMCDLCSCYSSVAMRHDLFWQLWFRSAKNILKTFARNSYTLQLLLYLDVVVISRYLFIFCLKKTVVFKMNSGAFSLTCWSELQVGCCLPFGVFRQIDNSLVITFALETTQEDFKKPLKYNGAIELGSLMIHLIVYFKIKLYKFTNPHPSNSFSDNTLLATIISQSLGSFTRNVINIGSLVFAECIIPEYIRASSNFSS
jgi:hypothetical protein